MVSSLHPTTDRTVFTGRRFWRGVTLAILSSLGAAFCVAGDGQSSERGSPWTTSRVKGSPDPPLPYRTVRIFEKVELDRPTNVTWLPAAKKWVANHANGKIVTFDNDPDHALAEPLLDLSDVLGQRVSVGLATQFHHDLERQPWCFLTFTSPPNSPMGHHLARLRVIDPTVPTFDEKSLAILASWKNTGHSGGSMQFGPDGMLYVSVGDGQKPYPPDSDGTGQDNRDLRSSILRLDVDDPTENQPYRIPKDNPFVGDPNARDEIWAFGFRNPWKIAFHPASGDLLAADVGWEMREMIHRVKRGGNHGWSIMEGNQTVKPDQEPTIPITPPLFEHTHLDSRSISGGHFWTSDRHPELKDAYIYGDWMTGKVWGLKFKGDEVVWQQELVDTPHRVICFMRDPLGEVLMVAYDGSIHRLEPHSSKESPLPFPTKLTDTGLFADVPAQEPSSGVVEYEISAHHWADGTHSRQWIGLPDQTQLGMYKKFDWKTGEQAGRFIFPVDTVVAKTVSYFADVNDPESERHIETQLLHKIDDEWRAYNYIWNEEQTDALLQSDEAVERKIVIKDDSAPDGVRSQTWRHANRSECLLCHIWSAGTVHGFWPPQLQIQYDGSDQLQRLSDLGLFGCDVPEVPALTSPDDESASLESRARSYLAMNCSTCHRNLGGGTANFNFEITNSLQENNYIDAVPSQGTFGISDARVVASGAPFQSVLLYRALKSGRGHMPQFGSQVIDHKGIGLLHDWIASMDGSEANKTHVSASPANSTELDLGRKRFEWMLSSVEGAMELALACGAGSMSEEQQELAIELGASHSHAPIRDLFEHFLPEDQRVVRLGASIDEPALLAIEGSVERGRDLFENAKDLSCRACHRIATVGQNVGPNLSGIGAQRTPAELLASILRPSEKIEPKYRARQILTLDGSMIIGTLVQEDDKEVVIADGTGKIHHIAIDDVEAVKLVSKSVMPEQLFSGMTPQQAADLLAYLSAQREVPPSLESP